MKTEIESANTTNARKDQTPKVKAKLVIKSGVKAGACPSCTFGTGNHNQTQVKAKPAVKAKLAIKSGVKAGACPSCGLGTGNHNQTQVKATPTTRK